MRHEAKSEICKKAVPAQLLLPVQGNYHMQVHQGTTL